MSLFIKIEIKEAATFIEVIPNESEWSLKWREINDA
jgi:hypothetical protein